MLQLGNVPLSFEQAKHCLLHPTSVCNLAAVKPKGGEGYLYQSTTVNEKLDFSCDQYRFIYKGSKTNIATGIFKRYYCIPSTKVKKKTVTAFRRHVYSRWSAEKSITPPIFLVHYIIDHTCHKDGVHGNSKTKTGLYFAASKECINSTKENENRPAKETYNKLQSKISEVPDQ